MNINEKIVNVLRKIGGAETLPVGGVPYEHTDEKKTTKLGYFLLFLMISLGLAQGQGFIDGVASNIKDPQYFSPCTTYLQGLITSRGAEGYSGYYGYGDLASFNNCQFSPTEIKFDVPAVVNEAKPLAQGYFNKTKATQDAQTVLYHMQETARSAKDDYSMALSETTANIKTPVFDSTGIKGSVNLARQAVAEAESILAVAKGNESVARGTLVNFVNANKAPFLAAQASYENTMRLTELFRALLQFVLIAPLFIFALRRYFRSARVGSQFAIIWAGIAVLFALLFAEVLTLFIYRIIPMRLLQELFLFFAQFEFLVTIGRYLLLLAAPVIFGGIVYFIQKRAYNPAAVTMRAYKGRKCTGCSMKITESMRHCPVCGTVLKSVCVSCGKDRIAGLKFCDQCGKE